MISLSMFDENDGGLGLKALDEIYYPIESGGGWIGPVSGGGFQPIDLIPVDVGPVDHQLPDIDPRGSIPVQTVGGAPGGPVGPVPVSTPVAGTTPTGPINEPPVGIDPSLLLIGGAVLLAVLVLK